MYSGSTNNVYSSSSNSSTPSSSSSTCCYMPSVLGQTLTFFQLSWSLTSLYICMPSSSTGASYRRCPEHFTAAVTASRNQRESKLTRYERKNEPATAVTIYAGTPCCYSFVVALARLYPWSTDTYHSREGRAASIGQDSGATQLIMTDVMTDDE